jgi:hypothetical protein
LPGFCEHDNEHSGSVKGGEFLDQFSNYQLLKDEAVLVIFKILCVINWIAVSFNIFGHTDTQIYITGL